MIRISTLLRSDNKLQLNPNALMVIDKQIHDNINEYVFGVTSESEKYKSYIVKVRIETPVSFKSQCEVGCNCLNFKYQHSIWLFRHRGLYDSINPFSNVLPKKFNKYKICKHVDLVLKLLLKHEY